MVYAAATLQATDNKLISYTDSGQGQPLVLIHAFPADKRLWDKQRELLEPHFRLITLDLWGFGESSPVDGQAISMQDYADEVKQLLDALHIDQAIIGGESMGGYVSLAFLEHYPHTTAGLILSNTQAIADSIEAKAKRETTAQDVLKNGTTDFINGFLPKILSEHASEATKNDLAALLSSQSAPALASALRGMALRPDSSALLAKTLVPILIITSDLDIVVPPAQSKSMHALAQNSRLIELKNTGHLANLEQADQWSEAIINMFHPQE